MANPLSKAAYSVWVDKMSVALRAHYGDQLLLVGDVEMTVDDVIALFDSLRVARARADATRIRYEQQLVARDAMWPEIHAMIVAICTLLRGRHGQYNPMLADFGIKPRRRVVLTSAQHAVAAAKRKATRALHAARAAQPAAPVPEPPPPAKRPHVKTIHPRVRLLWPRAQPTRHTPFS
jgi:hypothetical protein